MKVLVINAGSSSLKYQLIDMADESVIAKGLVERIGIEGSNIVHKKGGDKIEIKEKSKTTQRFKDIAEANAGPTAPAWMESDIETLSGTVVEKPMREQIDVPINETLIVELYSK